MLPLTIRVENAHHTDIDAVLAMEAVCQCLRDTLAFIVTCTGTNRVYVTPANGTKSAGNVVEKRLNILVFWLRMDLGITINLCENKIGIRELFLMEGSYRMCC